MAVQIDTAIFLPFGLNRETIGLIHQVLSVFAL